MKIEIETFKNGIHIKADCVNKEHEMDHVYSYEELKDSIVIDTYDGRYSLKIEAMCIKE